MTTIPLNTGASTRPRLLRAVCAVTLAAQAAFVLTWLIAAAGQGPGYSVLAHSISDMYAVTAPVGPATAIIIVFTVAGILTALFTLFAVVPTFRRSGWPGGVAAALLALSIFSVGDILTAFERLACRLADTGCTPEKQVANAGGALDSTYSTFGVGAFIAAAIFLSFAMNRMPAWVRWVWPTRVVGIVMFVFFVADGVLADAGLAGLFERFIAALGAASIAALAFGILRRSSAVTSG